MIVRLQNLSARKPVIADLRAIVDLLHTCETAEGGKASVTEEDIRNAWQAQGFTVASDAWVIVTNKGQVVAYTEVRQREDQHLAASLYVHPNYRGRGIGTLLIWLVEERARHLLSHIAGGSRVCLHIITSSLNGDAHHLLEREGYTHTHSFWRLMIDMQEVPATSFDEFYRRGTFTVDMVVDAQQLISGTTQQQRQGTYVARQYDVYEKELRAGQSAPVFAVIKEACIA